MHPGRPCSTWAPKRPSPWTTKANYVRLSIHAATQDPRMLRQSADRMRHGVPACSLEPCGWGRAPPQTNQTSNQTSGGSLVSWPRLPRFGHFPFHFPFRGEKGSGPHGWGKGAAEHITDRIAVGVRLNLGKAWQAAVPFLVGAPLLLPLLPPQRRIAPVCAGLGLSKESSWVRHGSQGWAKILRGEGP